MTTLSSENAFRKGLAALVDNQPKAASELFRQALDLERERSKSRMDMRYLSYYGLSLARAGLSSQTALQACKQAVSTRPDDPVLLLNLGRVYLHGGRLLPALDAFQRGLEVAPDNKILRKELAQIDRRRAPVLRFLHRDHPFNILLGRMRASMSRRAVGATYAGVSPTPR